MLGAASVAAAGGIALIDTARTFFLPPAGGWRVDNSFSLSDFEERILRPSVQAMAARIDAQMYTMCEDALPTRIDVLYGHSSLYPKMDLWKYGDKTRSQVFGSGGTHA